jgi:hypothetical protein
MVSFKRIAELRMNPGSKNNSCISNVHKGWYDVNAKKFLFTILAANCLFGLMACAYSGVTTTAEETKGVSAASGIQFDFADAASLLVFKPVENKVLTLKKFRVGTGRNRLLIVGVQAEERGKNNVSDMVISSVTYGGHALTPIPNSEVQLSSIYFKDGAEYFLKVALYYLLNPPSGAHDITVTFAGPVPSGNVGAMSLFNTEQAAPVNLVTNQKRNPSKKKEIITKITTRNDRAWVIDILGCGKKTRLENKTKDYTQRFQATEKTGGKSMLVGGTLSDLSAGEVSLHWVQKVFIINRLAHVAVEIAPHK